MSWLFEVILKPSRSRRFARWTALAASLVVVLLGINPVDASKKMPPLTHAEVSRVWVGISEDELYILRLSLAADGGGFGAYSFVDDEPHIFRISAWKYEPPAIHITIEPADQLPLVTGQLNGKIIGIRMHLTMSGKGWSRSLTFRREDALLGRWSKIKEAMTRLKLKE